MMPNLQLNNMSSTYIPVETCATALLPSGIRCMAGRQFTLMARVWSCSAALTITKSSLLYAKDQFV